MKLFIAFCLLSFGMNAQSKIRPFVKAGFYQNFLSDLWLNEIEIGGGAQFNDHFSLGLNGRFGVREFSRTPYSNFKTGVISLEPSYRILSNKFMFSPVIAYDAGIEIANNVYDKYTDLENFVLYSYKDYGHYKGLTGLYYGKAKILLSFQRMGLEVLIGVTYGTYIFQYYSYNYTTYKQIYYAKHLEYGIGYEMSLKYTFPMKKEKKIKEVN